MLQTWIVIGSERSFCGDFNDAPVQYLAASVPKAGTRLLAVSNRKPDYAYLSLMNLEPAQVLLHLAD
ncbi:MAG: hypothetical protein NMNS01_07610 [Nitrosomonas sp.]|nr:MAG: hypothetical protein NMNS01_07610 [Nitrosomonas sp.]